MTLIPLPTRRSLALVTGALLASGAAYRVFAARTAIPASYVSSPVAGHGGGCELGSVELPPIETAVPRPRSEVAPEVRAGYAPRHPWDSSGFGIVMAFVRPWGPDASLEQIRVAWERAPGEARATIDERLALSGLPTGEVIASLIVKATLLNYEGDPRTAYRILERARLIAESSPDVERASWLGVVFLQGVTALRCGENENCLAGVCRDASACILPLSAGAVHSRREGSRLAVRRFTEYLKVKPDDLECRWLLNVAHMTLGEHPAGVDPRFLISLDRFSRSEHGIGRFRDVSRAVGVDRLNEAGGAILDDFDGDGRLDLAVSSIDPGQCMSIYRNRGDGTFEDRTATSRGMDDRAAIVAGGGRRYVAAEGLGGGEDRQNSK